MDRLKIAERELRSFTQDRLANRPLMPMEISALSKIREARALIAEAEFMLAKLDAGLEGGVSGFAVPLNMRLIQAE